VSAEREVLSSRLLYTATIAAMNRLHRLVIPANQRALAFFVVADENITDFLAKARRLQQNVYKDVSESLFLSQKSFLCLIKCV
jgi:hypothetical protein